MRRTYILSLATLLACGGGSQSEIGGDISKDTRSVESGGKIFNRLCSPCHNFKQDGIGPQLGGLTRSVETDWIRSFVSDPGKMIREHDPRAASLFEEYQTYMPSYGTLSEEDIDDVLAYMHTFPFPEDARALDLGLKVVEDPIPDSVVLSPVVLDLEFYWQVPSSSENPPLARINEMQCERNTGRLFINDLRGKLYLLNSDKPSVYLDMGELIPDFIHQPGLGTGLGSYAFHPEFAENGLLYTTHAEPPGTAPADAPIADSIAVQIQYVLTEWTVRYAEEDDFSGTGRELLRMDMVTGKHGIQQISFNPTARSGDDDYGLLYVAIGDGASVEEGFPLSSHHQGGALWSSILRIDPLSRDSDNGKYGIPSDNPFASSQDLKREIWAYGFRNPNKLNWDQERNLYATDIGMRQIEEVNLIQRGSFYGWPIREGRFFLNHTGNMSRVYELPENDTIFNVTYPVIELDHDESRAIIGGLAYESSKISPLSGSYIFGDITSGRLFYAPLDEMQGTGRATVFEWRISIDGEMTSLKDLCGSNRVDLRFGQDCDGNLYIFTKADGKIYQVSSTATL